MTYGATIVACRTADRHGEFADIALGFERPEDYLERSPYFGAAIGRYANRIANARFILDGQTYALTANEGNHHLHGGLMGFDKHVWRAQCISDRDGSSVVVSRTSAAGEEGYPGNLDVTIMYTLSHRDELSIRYHATTDAPTPVNLTHHTYFNLRGEGDGDVRGHHLTLAASAYTPVTEALIPTGVAAAVDGTPFDFRTPVPIGERIDADDTQLRYGGGYDHNFVLDEWDGTLHEVATVWEPTTGRTLDVATTEPGVQFYSGNRLHGNLIGKAGRAYDRHAGFCLEPQHYPDSPNQPTFPSTILRPGRRYVSTTVYRFGIRHSDSTRTQ